MNKEIKQFLTNRLNKDVVGIIEDFYIEMKKEEVRTEFKKITKVLLNISNEINYHGVNIGHHLFIGNDKEIKLPNDPSNKRFKNKITAWISFYWDKYNSEYDDEIKVIKCENCNELFWFYNFHFFFIDFLFCIIQKKICHECADKEIKLKKEKDKEIKLKREKEKEEIYYNHKLNQYRFNESLRARGIKIRDKRYF